MFNLFRRDFDRADSIIAQMKHMELRPSVSTYTALMCGYAKIGQIDRIHQILEQFKEDELRIKDASISQIIYELALNGHADLTKSLIDRFREDVCFRVNLMIRLISIKQSDLAYEILCTLPQRSRPDGSPTDSGIFFLKQLAKANYPFDKMLWYANELEQSGRNADPKMVLLKSLLEFKRFDHALELLRELKSKYMQIEQLYFWPIFCSQSSNAEILNWIKIMKNEFQIDPNVETLKDFVVPNLKDLNANEMITALSADGISLSTAVVSVALHYIESNELKAAADVTNQYTTYLSPGLFRVPLINALNSTFDYTNYCIVLRSLYDNYHFREANDSSEQEKVSNSDILGMTIYDALHNCANQDRDKRAQVILRFCFEQSLRISHSQAARIRALFGAHISDDLCNLLEKLEHSTVGSPAMTKLRNQIKSHQRLEALRDRALANGENVDGLNRTLLKSYRNAHDAERYEKLLGQIEDGNSNFEIDDKIYFEMITLHAQYGDVAKVAATFVRARSRLPSLSIDKALRIATILCNRDAFDEAIKFLTLNKIPFKVNAMKDKKDCCHLLNICAKLGKVNETQSMFNCLTQNNYTRVDHDIAAPLINVHLVNNDLTNAVRAFDRILKLYDIAPMLKELMCSIIMADNSEDLPNVVSLIGQLHNRLHGLITLAIAYADCGKMKDAVETLAVLDLKGKNGVKATNKLSEQARIYFHRGQYDALERLIEITKDVNGIRRNELYKFLMLGYCNDKSPTRALGLWAKMQDENVSCSDDAQHRLGLYLQSKNVSVPFELPNVSHQKRNINQPVSYSSKRQPSTEAGLEENPSEMSVDKKYNEQLGQMLVENRLDEARDIVYKLLATKSKFNLLNTKIFLSKITANGDYETLVVIRDRISAELKPKLSLNNRICAAYMACGRAREYIDGLLSDFDEAKSRRTLREFMQNMPLGGILSLLEEHPELLGQGKSSL